MKEETTLSTAREQANTAIVLLRNNMDEMPPFSKRTLQLSFEFPGVKPTIIPCIILKGLAVKPCLWLQAVIHGDEYDGAIACLRLVDTLDLYDLNGSLLVLPLLNPSAFLAYQHSSPYDNVNLNRVFRKSNNASYSWEYGRFLLEIIRTMADFLIDFHGASKLNEICRFAGVANMGKYTDQYSFDVARRTGVDYILLDGNNQDKNNRDRLTVALSEYGIPAIVFENGGGLSWTEEAVRRHIYSARQVMYEAGFLKKGQSAACTGQPFVADQYVYFDIEGLLLEYLPLGTEVNKGDVCLKVLNVVTMGVQEVVSPCDGCFVFCIHNAAVVKRGDLALCLARKSTGINSECC